MAKKGSRNAFRLATVEKLRANAVEEMAQALGVARAAVAEAVQYQQVLEEALINDDPYQARTTDVLISGVAHRERIREELQLVGQELQRREMAAEDTRLAWLESRAQLKAVEVLHEAHREKLRAAALKAEQRELDDLVVALTARKMITPGGHS